MTLYRQEKELLSFSPPSAPDTLIRIKAVIYITFVFHVGGAETGSFRHVGATSPPSADAAFLLLLGIQHDHQHTWLPRLRLHILTLLNMDLKYSGTSTNEFN